MGCSDCDKKGGCDERKGDQRLVFDEVLGRIYPDRTWGRPDDAARFRAGVPRSEAMRLRRAIAELLRAPTFFRDGEASDLCHTIYVLCVGRTPALVDLRETPELVDLEAERIVERYLRISLSTVARLAAVQEVEMTLAASDDSGGADGEGGAAVVIRESPRAGVYEPGLLKRLRSLTALLASSDITYCDFGLLDKPVERSHPGDYVERYGVEPRLANFLFYEQPPTTAIITPLVVDLARRLSTVEAEVEA